MSRQLVLSLNTFMQLNPSTIKLDATGCKTELSQGKLVFCRPRREGLGSENMSASLSHSHGGEEPGDTREPRREQPPRLPGRGEPPARTAASVLNGNTATRAAAVRLSGLAAAGLPRNSTPSHISLPRALTSSSSRGRPLSAYVTTGERRTGTAKRKRTTTAGPERSV